MLAFTEESSIESFPNPTITKKLGEPTRSKIQFVHKLTSDNYRSIESTREGGNHGLVFIVQDTNTYHALTGYVFMLPTNPGLTPVILGGLRSG